MAAVTVVHVVDFTRFADVPVTRFVPFVFGRMMAKTVTMLMRFAVVQMDC